MGMVKNGCGQSGEQTLKLTLSQKCRDGVEWVFSSWYKLKKAKSWFKDFYVGVAISGHGLLVH